MNIESLKPFTIESFVSLSEGRLLCLIAFVIICAYLLYYFRHDMGNGNTPTAARAHKQYFFNGSSLDARQSTWCFAASTFSMANIGLVVIVYFAQFGLYIFFLISFSIIGNIAFWLLVNNRKNEIDGFDSIGKFMENAFDSPYVGRVSDTLSLIGMLSILTVEVFFMGLLFRTVFEIKYIDLAGVLFVFGVVAFYVAKGGFRATRKTDIYQLGLTFAALLFIFFISWSIYSDPALKTDAPTAATPDPAADIFPTQPPHILFWLPFVAILQLALPFGKQTMWQRVRATQPACRTRGVAGGVLVLFGFILLCAVSAVLLVTSDASGLTPSIEGFQWFFGYAAEPSAQQGLNREHMLWVLFLGLIAATASTADSALLSLVLIAFSGPLNSKLGNRELDPGTTLKWKSCILGVIFAITFVVYVIFTYAYPYLDNFESVLTFGVGMIAFVVFVPPLVLSLLGRVNPSLHRKATQKSMTVSTALIGLAVILYIVKPLGGVQLLGDTAIFDDGLIWLFWGTIGAFAVSTFGVVWCLLKKSAD